MSIGKTLVVALVVTLPVLVWDFTTRILPETGNVPEKQFESGITSHLRVKPSVRELSEVKGLLDDYKEPEPEATQTQQQPEAPAEPEVYIMPKELQEQQQGSIESLYSGNIKYQLVATITHNDVAMALLQSEDLKTSKSTLKRVTVGDELAEYTLEKVTSGQAIFNDKGREVILRVFSKGAQKESKENV